ncbi:ADP-ribosylglycohydrolase family protein [Endozoicomonas sp. GU-1]|uniref:ADP-ribosylglycohydrolase family protein n=1 Tax=Endozoicomonas sp. GU-1 TaxID=3009078 RepID=UPI0022B2B47E|nr:ADP-ribosylglycohydrolase family protein [Endozoicomonas sp. GU-1]WBA87153.1 ADP-ribosylglycohydrolase family protein [Endozoicomonas sp. GU-1]
MTSTSTIRSYPSNIDKLSRIKGGVAGLLIGDALGVGTHWYYDLDQLAQDYGPWIDTYQDPAVNGSHGFANISHFRYQQGVRAGDVSQTGQVIVLLLESLAHCDGLVLTDFLARLDDFFAPLSGESFSGRYTDELMVDLIRARRTGLHWGDPGIASGCDTTEGAQFVSLLALAIDDPVELVDAAGQLLQTFYREPFIRQNTLVFALVVQAMVNSVPLTELPAYLAAMAKRSDVMSAIQRYDHLLTPGNGQVAWQPETVRIEPALHISQVYGMDCQLVHLLPCAYYLMHRYPDQFEQGVLSAINGGGNNMARAALTGVLLGAMNGLEAIPERLLSGLHDSDRYLQLADMMRTQ